MARIDAHVNEVVINLAAYVTDFTGATDQAAQVAAAIAALPASGGIIEHPGGKVKISSMIDLSTTYVRFRGSLAALDNDVAHGAWFYTGTASQTLFSCKPTTGRPRQTGVQFERIGMLDTVGSCILLDTKDTNRLRLQDVTFAGFGGAGAHTTTGLVLDITPAVGSDSSWHTFNDCNFRSCQTGMSVLNSNGFTMDGGLFSAGYDCVGLDVQRGTHIFITNVNGNGCFPCFNVEGASTMVQFSQCYWESTDNSQPYRGWYLNGDGVSSGGYGHAITNCHATGNGSNSSGFYLDTLAHKAFVRVRTVNCGAGGITNLGSDNDVYEIGKGWLTPIRMTADTGPQLCVPTAGSPEGVRSAPVGSMCQDSVNGVLYMKKSGTGTTGWRQVTQDIQIEVTERKALAGTAQTATTAVVPVSTLAAGSTAVIACSSLANKTVTSVSDTHGHTWTVDVTANDGTRAISYVSAPITTPITSSDTVTITWSAATSQVCSVWLMQVDNLAASPFDKSASGTGTSTAPLTAATAALAQAREVVFCLVRTSVDSTFTPGTGFASANTPVLNDRAMLEYKNVNAVTAVTGSGTLNTSGTWIALAATYKQA